MDQIESDEGAPIPKRRGPSSLQKQILAIAYRNKIEAGPAPADQHSEWRQADVFRGQILSECFGWKRKADWRGGAWHECQPVGHEDLYGQNFLRSDIGSSKYNSNRASLTRALRRLEQRRLIRCARFGWALTEEGERIAAALQTATPMAILPHV